MYSDPRPRVLFLEIFSAFRKRRSFVYPPLPFHSCKTCPTYLRIPARSISAYVLTLHCYFFVLSRSRFQLGSDIKSIPQPSPQKSRAAAPYMSHQVCLLFDHFSVSFFFMPTIRKIDARLASINNTSLILRSLKAPRTDPRPKHTNNRRQSAKVDRNNCNRPQPLQASDFYRPKPF
jgi:hypothetical protein